MKTDARLHIKADVPAGTSPRGDASLPGADVRAGERFVVTRGEIEIRFRGEPMSLVDLSMRGVMATHAHRLTLRKSGLLTLVGTELGAPQPVGARVVWSQYSKQSTTERPLYISGLEITDDRDGVVREVMEFLSRIGAISFDEDWHNKKVASRARRAASTRVTTTTTGKPGTLGGSEAIRLSVQAHRYLSRNPDVQRIWVEKARLSLRPDHDNLEDLTIWEFLGRSVPMDMVVLARQLS